MLTNGASIILKSYYLSFSTMPFEALVPDNISPDTLFAGLLYLTLGGLYLVIIPLIVYFYLNQRWYVASSVERVVMYFLVFWFFPGMLLFSPFLNLRPKRRQVSA